MTVAPKSATLKVDGTAQPLTDGKYMADVEFDKEVQLVVELEGHTTETKKVKISADNEKNKASFELKKANVRNVIDSCRSVSVIIFLSFTVQA